MRTTHVFRAGDARDLSGIPDGSVALVVTSPPYPMIEMWDAAFAALDPRITAAIDGSAAFELMHAQLDCAWSEVTRTLVDGGLLCINIGDAVRTLGGGFRLFANYARVVLACTRLGLTPLPGVVWRKPANSPTKFMGSGMLPGAYVTLEHEHILIARKSARRTFDGRGAALRRRSAIFWEERNAWYSDLWALSGERQALETDTESRATRRSRERSAAFPLEIATRLILMHSVSGDTVLDPFAGTGTTLRAAIAMGRSSIGVEIDTGLVERTVADAHEWCEPAALLQRGRLASHRRFVTERLGKGHQMKHRSRHYGFPVVSAQETDICLPVARAVQASGDGELVVDYDQPPSVNLMPHLGDRTRSP